MAKRCRMAVLFGTALTLAGGVNASLTAQVSATAGFPAGKYVVVLVQGDAAPPQAMGEWEFQVDSLGQYQWVRGTNVLVQGDMQVHADTATLNDRTGDESVVCPEPGVYRWVATSEGLEFAVVSDSCGSRPILLGSRRLRPR